MRIEIIKLLFRLGRAVDENKAAGKSEYNGKTYYFCAPGCKKKFDADPSAYIKD